MKSSHWGFHVGVAMIFFLLFSENPQSFAAESVLRYESEIETKVLKTLGGQPLSVQIKLPSQSPDQNSSSFGISPDAAGRRSEADQCSRNHLGCPLRHTGS